MNAPNLLTGLLLAALAVAPSLQAQQAGEAPAQAPGSTQAQAATQNPFPPFSREAFEKAMRTLGADDAKLLQFGSDVAEVGLPRAADTLLRSVHEGYAKAVQLAEDGDPKAPLALAQLLDQKLGPIVDGYARYQLARLFLDSDDPERTVELLNGHFDTNLGHTPLDGEVAYFYAQALAEIPRPDLALPRLKAFLAWFPDASERFRATAMQRVAELERQQESRLHGLADRMKKVGRDLKKQKTNEPIQVEQKEMVEELDQLIEMYEEQERQAGGPPSGNGNPNGPASQSALPEGEGRIGNLEKKVSLADRWGPMRDSDRKEIESAVQNTLSPEFKKLIEDYYKRLGTGGNGK